MIFLLEYQSSTGLVNLMTSNHVILISDKYKYYCNSSKQCFQVQLDGTGVV